MCEGGDDSFFEVFESITVPFTTKFFTYTPSERDDVAETNGLQALYKQNETTYPPVYFESWLATNPDVPNVDVSEAKEKYTKDEPIDPETVKALVTQFKDSLSPEYQQSWNQIKTVVRAIQDWAAKHEINDPAIKTRMLPRQTSNGSLCNTWRCSKVVLKR